AGHEYDQGNYLLAEVYDKEALGYFQQALQNYSCLEYTVWVSSQFNEIAYDEFAQKHYETALDYIQRAIKEASPKDPDLHHYCYRGAVTVYELGDKESALKWLQAAYDHAGRKDRNDYKKDIADLESEIREENLKVQQTAAAQRKREAEQAKQETKSQIVEA